MKFIDPSTISATPRPWPTLRWCRTSSTTGSSKTIKGNRIRERNDPV